MKRKLFIVLLILLSFLTCDKDPYTDYTALGPEGLYFKVIHFKEEGLNPQHGDVMQFRMGRVEFDSLVWMDSKVQIMQCDTLQPGLRSVLSKFHIGDSISILMEPDAYRTEFGEYPHPLDRVSDMRVSVLGVIPEIEWLEALELSQATNSEREQILLSRYFAQRSDSSEFSFEHGIWKREILEGTGRSFLPGEELLVMYTATLLDGTIIDERKTHEEALSYALGMQGQLVPGLVTAIKHMKRGQELELILPSSMAFGEKGSAGGIVLPWTPVRYMLRVDRLVEALP